MRSQAKVTTETLDQGDNPGGSKRARRVRRLSRIITRIAKWVARKAAYRAGIRDEVRNKPLRQYRDPSLQVAYMFGRFEVREYH